MEQRTPEWFAARLGHVTASGMANVNATIKSGEAAARTNYRIKLITERLTGQAEETFTSPAMAHGTEQEPIARIVYEAFRDVSVQECGFIQHKTIKWFGASPDGLIGDDGLIEIKCPNTSTHLQYWMANKVPEKYKDQMLAQLACTGRAWCDFVSFDNRMPADMALFVVRFTPTLEEIKQTEASVVKFLSEIETHMEMIKKRRNNELSQ